MEFYGDDPVAVLSSNIGSSNVRTVDQVRKDNLANNGDFWNAINSGQAYTEKLTSPILVSGGVFLLDQPNPEHFDPFKARVPLLMRDIAANADPLRLTMPAGRMDKLNLADVCISELAEEMIFFGGETGHQIQIVAPGDYVSKVIKTVKSRLIKGDITVPGLDPAQIKISGAFDRQSHLVNLLATKILQPLHDGWKVSIRYKVDRLSESIETQKPIELALIPDQSAATLEFRLIMASNLTGATDHPTDFDSNSLKLGWLRGVVDGDGYERLVLFVSFDELQKYVQEVDAKGGAVLKTSDPHDDSLPIIAVTDGKTGRFRKIPPNYHLSVAALTTTVSKLVL